VNGGRIRRALGGVVMAVLLAGPLTAAYAAEPTPQETRARNQKIGAAASALLAVSGFVLAIRRFRTRSRLPTSDKKFGSYRGPKT
jgi:hypothetical protein